jgi:hypothetical protein
MQLHLSSAKLLGSLIVPNSLSPPTNQHCIGTNQGQPAAIITKGAGETIFFFPNQTIKPKLRHGSAGCLANPRNYHFIKTKRSVTVEWDSN